MKKAQHTDAEAESERSVKAQVSQVAQLFARLQQVSRQAKMESMYACVSQPPLPVEGYARLMCCNCLAQEVEEARPRNAIHFVVDFLCKHYPEHLKGFASVWNAGRRCTIRACVVLLRKYDSIQRVIFCLLSYCILNQSGILSQCDSCLEGAHRTDALAALSRFVASRS